MHMTDPDCFGRECCELYSDDLETHTAESPGLSRAIFRKPRNEIQPPLGQALPVGSRTARHDVNERCRGELLRKNAEDVKGLETCYFSNNPVAFPTNRSITRSGNILGTTQSENQLGTTAYRVLGFLNSKI
jgi:hypothetical protein